MYYNTPTVTGSQDVLHITAGSTLNGVPYNEQPIQTQVIPATTTQPVSDETVVDEKTTTSLDEDTRLLCNCYSYVKEVYNNLPNTKIILSNLADEGEVAVFYYPTSGVYHYAVVVSRDGDTITIDETNFNHCKFSRRVINEDYPMLLGFYSVG